MVAKKKTKRTKKAKRIRRKKSTDTGIQVVKAITGTGGIQGQDLEKETTTFDRTPKSIIGRIETNTKKTSERALLVLTWPCTDRDCKKSRRLKNYANNSPKPKVSPRNRRSKRQGRCNLTRKHLTTLEDAGQTLQRSKAKVKVIKVPLSSKKCTRMLTWSQKWLLEIVLTGTSTIVRETIAVFD